MKVIELTHPWSADPNAAPEDLLKTVKAGVGESAREYEVRIASMYQRGEPKWERSLRLSAQSGHMCLYVYEKGDTKVLATFGFAHYDQIDEKQLDNGVALVHRLIGLCPAVHLPTINLERLK